MELKLPKDIVMGHLWNKDGTKNIPGWWKDILFDVYLAINTFQTRNNIKGNLGEIGVRKGRSLVPLYNLATPEEKTVAIDISDLTEVRDLCNRVFGSSDNLILEKKDSKDTNFFDAFGPYRMFYVDGDHSTKMTLNDLNIAKRNIQRGGIFFLDDYENPSYGDAVRKAINQFINANTDFEICFCSGQTLWITSKEYSEAYRECVSNIPDFQANKDVYYDVLNHNHKDGVYYWKQKILSEQTYK